MSDVHIERLPDGWTVRHEKILFERFADEGSALRRARSLAAALTASGDVAGVRRSRRPGSRRSTGRRSDV